MTDEQKRAYDKVYYGAHKGEIKARLAANRSANKMERRIYEEAYYKANKDVIKARGAAYRVANRDKIVVYRTNNRANNKRRQRQARETQRKSILSLYGSKCVCCGESAEEFLTLDHLKGGGNAHRLEVGGNGGVYRSVLKEGYRPDKYQILCFNCNCSRGRCGYCPHGKERPDGGEVKGHEDRG